MTTQHTHYEQSDVDATVVEHLFTPETAVSSTATEILSPTEGDLPVFLPSPAQPTDPQDAKQDEASVAQGENITGADTTEVNRTKGNLSETDTAEANPVAVDMEQTGSAGASPAEMGTDMAGANMTGTGMAGTGPATTVDVPPLENTETIENEAVPSEPVVESSPTEPTQTFGEEHTAFSFMEEVPLDAVPGEVRSFTDYIEEFRQTEAWQSASLQESQGAFSVLTALTSDVDTIYQAPTQSDTPVVPSVEIGEVPPTEVPAAEKIETAATPASPVEELATVDSTSVRATDETTSVETPTLPISAQPAAPPSLRPPAERPVSPLLRPATRLRLPRHGNVRQREEDLAGGTSPTPEVPPVPQAIPAPAEAAAEPEQTKPARRYRFDRPATSSTPTGSSGVTSPLSASPAPTSSAQQQRAEESREKDLLNRSSLTTPGRPENGQSGSGLVTETQPKQTANGNSSTLEQPATKLQEPVTPELTEMERRRRYGQDRQQEQPPSAPPTGQTVPVSPVPPAGMSATPQPEVAATPVPAVPQAEEIAPEDLPPLEYSELQKASSRRRRRHRAGPNNGSPGAAKSATPEAPAPAASQVMTPAGGTPPTPAMPTTPPRAPNNTVATQQQYNIVSGYTLNQMNQGNDHTGPFMAPEPSPARGSVSTRDGRNVRAEAQRTPVYPARSPDVAPSVTSIQHLGSILSQAIQTQTDRMVTELRRANQTPANISVSLPAFPSTERVGVFVDVANLLYSARTLRISIDFGKLLDFLRGNRRLVRAHAYCPTSPQPGDEQMFLQAVKGLGYRITTKNYKTFASGAKKADLDLDLCMDVVRLVEGRAIDCVVLVSGDSDFMPMLDYCSDHGVRVEVAAFDEAMSATLRQSCDLFINLSMLEEIRS